MIKNLKKVISTFAAVAMLATSASAFAVTFPDVDKSANYAGSVEALTALGVVNGDENGKFNPENTVTRAEFAKMVVEALGAGNEASSSTDTKFDDAKGHWAAGYIEIGVAKEFINGYDDTTFGPDDKVTYAQAVKMLVSAIGYETYASKQGGWPSGYLAYGSELNIINGVSGVTNDTALTRAQCAVLVYNAMKAPICIVNGYNQVYNGTDLVWIPNLEKQNGENDTTYKSLLTEKHDAYVVKGRINDYDVDAVKGDTVDFTVELADNFDGEKVKAYKNTLGEIVGTQDITAYLSSATAKELLFTYAEAIVAEDTDTNEYTILAITPYGSAKTVEFAAKDVKTALNTSNEIEVKKDGTTKTNDYELDTSAQLYVNGVKVGVYATKMADVDNVAELLTDNKAGVVTLIRTTDVASTSADDLYDYVMITYYQTAKVTAVDVDDELAVITSELGDIEIDLEEDPDRKVAFYKDGAEVTYKEVKKNDIISVACKFGGSVETDDIDVYVSDKVVSGTVTGRNTTKETITVDGTVYDVASGSYDVGGTYDLRIDAFGYVVEGTSVASSKTLGIVAGVYKANSGDWNVKMITAEGAIKTYPAKAEDAAAIKAVLDSTLAADASIYAEDIDPEDAIIEYRIDSNGYIKMKGSETAIGGTNKKYSEELEMIGGYTISETATKIVSVGNYFTTGTGSVSAMSMDRLEDEAKYEAYVANDIDGVYSFVVIVGDLGAARATSALAVVQATGETTTAEDGEEVSIVTVAVNGEKDVDVLFAETVAAGLNEGDVIMYTVGTEGYVEKSADLQVIYTADATADAMYTNRIGSAGIADWTAKVANAYITKPSGFANYTITVNGDENEDVEVYYGPVYTATDNSLRIFEKTTYTPAVPAVGDPDSEDYVAGVPAKNIASFVDDVKSFAIGNANVYSYNYSKAEDEGLRVTATGLAQDKSYFKVDNASEFDFNTMTAARVNPRMALVRVVDNVVTDVVYYKAK